MRRGDLIQLRPRSGHYTNHVSGFVWICISWSFSWGGNPTFILDAGAVQHVGPWQGAVAYAPGRHQSFAVGQRRVQVHHAAPGAVVLLGKGAVEGTPQHELPAHGGIRVDADCNEAAPPLEVRARYRLSRPHRLRHSHRRHGPAPGAGGRVLRVPDDATADGAEDVLEMHADVAAIVGGVLPCLLKAPEPVGVQVQLAPSAQQCNARRHA
mmetsp:Transcript_90376/g.264427  ORF Transcript_90376/g.264427 Transcript_90376/m.264427 type:complete len:210 (+) Transcript_90376:871-1500(+)